MLWQLQHPAFNEAAAAIILACVIGGLGGLAILLRSTQPLTVRVVFAAILNSGVAATLVTCLGFQALKATPLLLLGLAGLAALGSGSALSLILSLVRSKRFKVVVSAEPDDDDSRADRASKPFDIE